MEHICAIRDNCEKISVVTSAHSRMHAKIWLKAHRSNRITPTLCCSCALFLPTEDEDLVTLRLRPPLNVQLRCWRGAAEGRLETSRREQRSLWQLTRSLEMLSASAERAATRCRYNILLIISGNVRHSHASAPVLDANCIANVPTHEKN